MDAAISEVTARADVPMLINVPLGPSRRGRRSSLTSGFALDAQDCDLPGRDFNGPNGGIDSDRHGDFLHAFAVKVITLNGPVDNRPCPRELSQTRYPRP